MLRKSGARFSGGIAFWYHQRSHQQSEESMEKGYLVVGQPQAASQTVNKNPTAMDRLNEHLAAVNRAIKEAASRARNLADRHVGPESESENTKGPTPVPNGTFGEAAAKLENIDGALNYLRQQLSR